MEFLLNTLRVLKTLGKKAAEIKRTAKLYKAGKKINLKAVEKSRVKQSKKMRKK